MSTRIRKGDSLPGVLPSAWTVSQCAATLQVNYNTVLRMIAAGTLRAVKPGKEYRIPDSELQRFLAGDSAA